tara:strand:+ start:664 stop:1386 length:723 start_codon:yes stop_codon:yes gene_type:complete
MQTNPVPRQRPVSKGELAQLALKGPNVYASRARTEHLALGGDYGAKQRQAWKYKGGQIQRAETLWLISGVKHRDPKEPPGVDLPRRLEESNFFITINTNKSPVANGVTADVAGTAAANAMDILLQQMDRFVQFGGGQRGNPEFVNDIFQAVVKDVEWTPSVEMGPALNRLHTHTVVRLVHYSQLRINTRWLQETFKDAWNGQWAPGHTMRIDGMPYVDVKLRQQRNAHEISLAYAAKLGM